MATNTSRTGYFFQKFLFYFLFSIFLVKQLAPPGATVLAGPQTTLMTPLAHFLPPSPLPGPFPIFPLLRPNSAASVPKSHVSHKAACGLGAQPGLLGGSTTGIRQPISHLSDNFLI